MAKFKLEDGTEIEAFTKEEMEAEVQGLKSKTQELLGKLKEREEKISALEPVQQQLSKIEEERQKEKGEFKALYEKTQAELQKEREAARNFKQAIQSKELEGEALKLSTQLTRDTKRAELLKKEVLQFAKHTDDGVVFEVGGVAIPPDKLVEKIREDYPFLVDGNGATGGGAKGNTGNGEAGIKPNVGGTKAERIAYAKQFLASTRE
jgi:DNA repair exonuclease SbcCD ATPase subunit